MRGFLWMKRLAERPPSRRRIILVTTVLGLCLVLWGYERLFGWPEALKTERIRGLR